MTKDELLALLRECAESSDRAIAHSDADGLLLIYINDPDITAAFEAIDKWYE